MPLAAFLVSKLVNRICITKPEWGIFSILSRFWKWRLYAEMEGFWPLEKKDCESCSFKSGKFWAYNLCRFIVFWHLHV